jgi:hypothetical protein
MLGIPPHVIHRVKCGLDTFNMDDDNNSDIDRDDPSNQPFLWGQEDEGDNDNALVYTIKT